MMTVDINDWEIDDETLMKHFDELEEKIGVASSSHIDFDVDHVPETQFEPVPRKFHSGSSTLHGRLCEVVSAEMPSHQHRVGGNLLTPIHPVGPSVPRGQRSYPTCYCGVMCVVVVCRKEKNAGRRFFGCSSYNEHRLNPREYDCCNYFKWIDQPLCERGLEYAHELQAEISRLKIVNEELRTNIGRPRMW